jgi:hypothetical protein
MRYRLTLSEIEGRLFAVVHTPRGYRSVQESGDAISHAAGLF